MEANIGDPSKYESIDLNSKTGKGLLRKRLMIAGRWALAIIITNAIVEKAIGRKPWTLSSVLPFSKYIFGSGWLGTYGMGPEIAAPQQYVGEFKQAIADIIKYGNLRRARKWMVKYHLPAGIQINRMADGIMAYANGGQVSDVRGHKMYKVDPDEMWKAILGGPSITTAGKEYYSKQDKSKKKEEKPEL